MSITEERWNVAESSYREAYNKGGHVTQPVYTFLLRIVKIEKQMMTVVVSYIICLYFVYIYEFILYY